MSELNEVLIGTRILVALTTFRQLKTFTKNQKELKLIFITLIGLGEKTMNRPDQTVILFDGLFLKKYE